MVYRKTRKRSSIARKIGIFTILLFILMITMGTILGINIKNLQRKQQAESNPPEIETIKPPMTAKQPVVNFQPIIDEWVAAQTGESSVIVYDAKNQQMLAEHNSNEIYNAASLYKLFVVYEGYRNLERGQWQPESLTNTGYTVLDCLDLAIRESNSECAEELLKDIGIAALQQTITTDFDASNTNLSNITSTPRDILQIMKAFYAHPDISNNTYIAKAKDSFLNQPPTIYDWRQGLPSGFKTAKVYDKVGWDYNPAGYWNVYHDAAIVDFPEQNQQYIIIVMTSRVPFENIRDLGANIENAVISTY